LPTLSFLSIYFDGPVYIPIYMIIRMLIKGHGIHKVICCAAFMYDHHWPPQGWHGIAAPSLSSHHKETDVSETTHTSVFFYSPSLAVQIHCYHDNKTHDNLFIYLFTYKSKPTLTCLGQKAMLLYLHTRAHRDTGSLESVLAQISRSALHHHSMSPVNYHILKCLYP
jgi:hypothetical protein